MDALEFGGGGIINIQHLLSAKCSAPGLAFLYFLLSHINVSVLPHRSDRLPEQQRGFWFQVSPRLFFALISVF